MIPARTGGEGACQDTGAQPVQQEAHGEWHRAWAMAVGLWGSSSTQISPLFCLWKTVWSFSCQVWMLHTDLVVAQGGMIHKKSQPLPRNIPKLLPARPRFGCWARQTHRSLLFWQSKGLGTVLVLGISSSEQQQVSDLSQQTTQLNPATLCPQSLHQQEGRADEGLESCDIEVGRCFADDWIGQEMRHSREGQHRHSQHCHPSCTVTSVWQRLWHNQNAQTAFRQG